MSAPRRSGGRAVLPDGATIIWSVAEGVRGRRWREAVTIDGGLVRSVLLEISTTGRPTRLEMTTAAGLLTLHPSPDERELHGNVVTPGGVRHLRFRWSPGYELVVVGSPGAAAVAVGRMAGVLDVGASASVAMVSVDVALRPALSTWQVTRSGATTWRLRDTWAGDEWTTSLDPDGVPVLAGGAVWPLQAD